MGFFLFTIKLIRFWILHSDWVRLNLFISCFIMVCLHGKVIVINCSWIDVFIAVATSVHNKVSFNIERFKNFLSFSPILFIIFGALLTLYILTSVCIFSLLFLTFLNVLAGRIFLTIQRFFSLLLFPLFSTLTLMFDSGVILKGETT